MNRVNPRILLQIRPGVKEYTLHILPIFPLSSFVFQFYFERQQVRVALPDAKFEFHLFQFPVFPPMVSSTAYG